MLTEQIRAVFSVRGEPFEIEITARPGHAEALARRAAEDGIPTVLYVCGGDGTLGEAAQALPGHPQLALAPGSDRHRQRLYPQLRRGGAKTLLRSGGARRRTISRKSIFFGRAAGSA